MRALAAAAAAAAAAEPTSVEIAAGVRMPRVSLGTCCGSDPAVGIPAWAAAGGAGIDTAWDYHDQPAIATALRALKANRSDFFITTKIPAGCGAFNGNTTDCATDPEVALRYVRDDVAQLGVDYVDLVLLHGPCAFARPAVADPAASDNALWRGLQAARAQGLTRAIGVSNYDAAGLSALRGPPPAVNQCRMGVVLSNTTLPLPPLAHDDATIAYCQAHGITYQAWRVVGGCPMTDPRVSAIAAEHNKTAAQVCMRWTLQQGVIVAAGTGADPVKAREYAAEDLGLFDWSLSAGEMRTLSGIAPA